MDKIIIFSILLKSLLIQSYFSTDFEVHRNWLRITSNKPINEWYYDDLSKWTLDYPPFFAYFEYILSLFTQYFDPFMISENSINYYSIGCLIFQRLTVIISELTFYFAIKSYLTKNKNENDYQHKFALILVFLQFGYLVVDHIHFQYNAFIQGILIYSIKFVEEKEYLKGALLFSIVLNLKHIYLYVASAFFLHLLFSYCLQNKFKLDFTCLIKLATVVLSIFIISFLPFLNLNDIKQIISRLFPFQRGLVHAYWAPNFWALYCFSDKILNQVFNYLQKDETGQIKLTSTTTSGVVQETKFQFLPEVQPNITLILIILISLPLWIKLIRSKNIRFISVCALQAQIFFMFGYHVHEKAILISLNLFQLYSIKNRYFSKDILMMSYVSGLTLFPLLPESHESIVKTLMFYVYHIALFVYYQSEREQMFDLNYLEQFIVFSGVYVQLYSGIMHPLILKQRFEFLPLMGYSVYGALCLSFYTIKLYAKELKTIEIRSSQKIL